MEACGICLQEIKETDLWVEKSDGFRSDSYGSYQRGRYHTECYRVKRKKSWIIFGIIIAVSLTIFLAVLITMLTAFKR